MSASTSSIFNGTSTFSSDFNQVITRAVSIASLPITQLTSNVNTLTSEQSALSNLSSTFSTLRNAVAGINTAAGNKNYAISYSQSNVASAAASSDALSGTYTLEVDNPGSQATAASTSTVSDPTTENISTSASFTLTANGQTYSNIVPPPNANTLTSLVNAINTATQGAVRATIVNVGSTAAPVYQLSVSNTAYGPDPITLADDSGNNLLGAQSDASPVQYRVNGQPDSSQDPLTSDSRTLTLSPNLTATVIGAGTTDITVSQSASSIASALKSFASAYNSAAQALTAQRGTNGGALSGQSIINSLSQSLHNLVTYGGGSGSVKSIADLGLTFDDTTGALTFNPTTFNAAAAGDSDGLSSFLGGATTGGFLQVASNTLNGILDSTTGALPNELKAVAGEITSANDKISTVQDRVDRLQTDLTARMTAADAAIAAMQQQLIYMTNLFTSMTVNQNQIANG